MVKSNKMLHFTDFGLRFSTYFQASAMKQDNIAKERDILLTGV
jgi:hypothetical protein